MAQLSGWTKVGDRVGGTGKWTLYRHKGRQFDSVEAADDFGGDQPKALKTFAKKAEGIRRGGLWLVDPDGVVQRMAFITPGR